MNELTIFIFNLILLGVFAKVVISACLDIVKAAEYCLKMRKAGRGYGRKRLESKLGSHGESRGGEEIE